MSSTPSLNSMLFNLAGGVVLLTAAGYMVTSYFLTPAVEPCVSRFPSGVQMTFDGANGKPMTPVELQARSGSREWGLLKNAKVVTGAGAPAGGALEVSLASTDDEENTSQNGVGFTWQLPELTKASSACLSYSAYLPSGFAFKEHGLLPGLFGASDITQIDEVKPEDSFATRMGWAESGDLGVDVRIPASTGYWEVPRRKLIWPTGRWVAVQQEIKLNTPGQGDGALRVWIDGSLMVDSRELTLRKSQQSVLSGVVSDIGYARTLSDVAAVRVSPFTIQWQ